MQNWCPQYLSPICSFLLTFPESCKRPQNPKQSEGLSEAGPKGRIFIDSVSIRFLKLTIYIYIYIIFSTIRERYIYRERERESSLKNMEVSYDMG